MKRSYAVEFWNFVCHFGEHKLLDFYLELVHEAFFDTTLIRTYGDSSWFFYDTQLLIIDIEGEDLPFVYGKLVKDFELQRDQVYQDDELVKNTAKIQNSPSSIFILSLLDHRLFFIKEQPDSPSMDSFKATIEKFINIVKERKVRKEYEAHEKLRSEHKDLKRKTLKSLRVQFPQPDIEIIPLASDAGIDEFIKSLKRIDLLQLDLVTPNDEADSNDFFVQWRKKQSSLGKAKSRATFKKDTQKSLPHGAVADLAKEAVKDENTYLTIKGKDIKDDDLKGTAESFRLKKTVNELEGEPTLLTSSTYKTFLTLIKDGIIRGPRISDKQKVLDKIKHILLMLR